MKYIITFCFAAILILNVKSQAKLNITRLANLPDTVYLNEIRNVTATLKNVGNSAFSGLVYFDVMVDSANGGPPTFFRLDSVFVNLSAIGGLDSIEAFYQVPIVSPAGFKVGGNGNTVVIWPRAKNNTVPYDSIVVPVYVKNSQVDIKELLAFSEKLSIYPNPAIDLVKINSDELQLINSYKIFEITGKELSSKKFSTNINVDFLLPGIYFIEFYDENHQRLATKKIIKQ